MNKIHVEVVLPPLQEDELDEVDVFGGVASVFINRKAQSLI